MLSSAESAASGEVESAALQHFAKVSVVVPVGPGDESWRGLLEDLESLPPDSELFLIATADEPAELQDLTRIHELHCLTCWKITSPGRAEQMNLGAQLATREYMWFLHADSRLSSSVLEQLDRMVGENVDALMFFDLEFRDDGPAITRWNAKGARFRSRVLGMPFGDQGFCLRRETFFRLGGFDETAEYGEDHLLVWKARQQEIPLQALDAKISTSARKYDRIGWLRTTLSHLWLTARQALPQWWRLATRSHKQ